MNNNTTKILKKLSKHFFFISSQNQSKLQKTKFPTLPPILILQIIVNQQRQYQFERLPRILSENHRLKRQHLLFHPHRLPDLKYPDYPVLPNPSLMKTADSSQKQKIMRAKKSSKVKKKPKLVWQKKDAK